MQSGILISPTSSCLGKYAVRFNGFTREGRSENVELRSLAYRHFERSEAGLAFLLAAKPPPSFLIPRSSFLIQAGLTLNPEP